MTLPTRANARHSDPETSKAAAASLTPKRLRQSQLQVLDLLKRTGPAHHEHLRLAALQMGMPISDSGLRTRCSELVAGGYVRDSGRRERLPSGREAIVWEIVPSHVSEEDDDRERYR